LMFCISGYTITCIYIYIIHWYMYILSIYIYTLV
jgi:hypothetical protein